MKMPAKTVIFMALTIGFYAGGFVFLALKASKS